MSTIKTNPRRKNNKNLITKSQQELRKTQQKLVKSQRELIKSQRELKKNTTKINKSNKSKQTLSNTKERIEVIRKKLNELHNNFSKSELKEIRNHLSNIENKNDLKNSNKYLNELDKKIIELNEYNNNNDDFIENVRDLFNIVNYELILIKTGFDNNYLEYRSEGNDSLSFEEYLNLIKPYLNDLINTHKNKGEWKIQLTAQINFISLSPSSDETRIMLTRNLWMVVI